MRDERARALQDVEKARRACAEKDAQFAAERAGAKASLDEVQRLRKALNELDCERDELEASLRARDESAAALEEQLAQESKKIVEAKKKYANKNLYSSLSVYGVGFHRHNSEIEQELKMATNKKFNFTFTPHLTPMFRGILSTIYVELKKGVNIRKLEKTLNAQFVKNRFVKLLKTNSLISTNDVINTNNCYLSICKTKYKNRVIILSAIDNLIKGGAGQAIQNMNLKFNFLETKGLK